MKTNFGFLLKRIMYVLILFVITSGSLRVMNTQAGGVSNSSDIAESFGAFVSIYALLLNNSPLIVTVDAEFTVVDTGQNTCYDKSGSSLTCPESGESLYGQDAQYTTNASSYTNNGDGTVTDHNSGLVWQRHHSDAMPYRDADGYCDGLMLGGESDWRVPTIKELYSLIDFNGYTGNGEDTYDSWTPANWKLYIDGSWDPTDDSATFIQETGNNDTGGRILDGQVWSSTDPVGITMNRDDSVLGGNFLDGRIKAYPKNASKFTRCVRGKTSYGENTFEITDGGKTVTDHATGLVWTKAYSNDTEEFPEVLSIPHGGAEYGAMEWEGALSFCENLDYGGYTDWKLPDIKELHSIVKNPGTEGQPAIDTDYFDLAAVEFPDYCNDTTFFSYPYFWSSTSHMEYSAPSSTPAVGNKAAYIAFGNGWGNTDGSTWIDVHAPGAQRSDPKTGDPSSDGAACGRGPQGDYISIYNHVRCVREDVAGQTADFSATPAAVNEGDSVAFTDLSTGDPVSWSWTFAGGIPSTSNAQNPTVTYGTAGSYAVTLTVTNSDSSYSTTKTEYITVTANGGVFDGYILMASLQSFTTYLIDTDESVVHTWTSSYRPGNSAYLLEDGTLLRTGSLVNGNRFIGTGGIGGIVEKLDWNGNVDWSYSLATDDSCLHHDVEFLPNGNILIIAWEYKSSDEAVAAGRNPSLLADGELWPDKIIEVNPIDDTIVWEWHVWDHLVQNYDSTKANFETVADHPELIDLNYVNNPNGIADWNHVNSVDYNAELDQIILSVHGFDELWVIDHSTTTAEAASHFGGTYGKGGDLLYRWGNPTAYGASGDHEFFGQHDAQWIPSDIPGAENILVFNNGQGRGYSTVEEIVPSINPDGSYPTTVGQAFGPASQEWIYQAPTPTDFYSQNISGAQRLSNGNTLICSGANGYIFEVTHDGIIVWTYQNTDGTSVFRVYKYPYDYSGLSQL